ncbi:MAG: InlB B-repeat-containing protein, partial [Paludibacteraceae bacterium]|nr:InlB B-repeat-containing protein [Paludibacteraceae bacterium]
IYENCTFEVAVNANNEDYGTVTGSGVFKMGQTIQLTATANEGYRFKGWSDGVMDASREITVTKDTSITANFVALYTIKALASASQGTVSGGGLYEIGETATLVANAKTGYTFAQWVDGSDENPRTVTVNGNKTYTAIFSIDKHNVTLSKNISAAGTVTGDGVYEHNTTVQLTATANEGYRFKGWSDGVMDASREITVTKDTSITANFVALYTIKALASASQGTVIGGGVYEDGETVTLVANPNPGYIFAQWVDGSDENPRNVTVDGDKTYTAYFIEGEQDKYMITWKNWDGRVIKTSEVSYGEVPAFDGEKPTRPDETGYTFTFSGWSPTIAAASQNAEYTANYIQTATEAEKTTVENEGTVNITTTDNTALFTWPENASADTYTLTITRNDEVFCSLTFDGQGRLINLNFPNLRASAEGYQFTVTGLNSGTDYAYDLKAKNGAATVNEYTGEFRTSGDAATAVPETEESVVETARYDINGRPLNAPTKGVNIVKYSDGSFEKEFVK